MAAAQLAKLEYALAMQEAVGENHLMMAKLREKS
jgi:hypothetical protein